MINEPPDLVSNGFAQKAKIRSTAVGGSFSPPTNAQSGEDRQNSKSHSPQAFSLGLAVTRLRLVTVLTVSVLTPITSVMDTILGNRF